MDINGDIKFWTECDKACARLYANGPEGPIVVQASAPLGPIRRRVARALARRGVEVSGNDTGYKATVERLARKKALKRLKVVAPAAFGKGGLATHLARKELVKRGLQRQALAKAGRPVGTRAIGPVPPRKVKRVKRKRRQGAVLPPRHMLPLTLAPIAAAAALTPMMRPAQTALPPRSSGGGAARGAGREERGAGQSANAQASPYPSDTQSDQDAELEDEQGEAAYGADSLDEGSDGRFNDAEDDADYEDGEDVDAVDEDEGAEGDVEVGGEEQPQLQRYHVQQAAALLTAARRNPDARRRVLRIVELAGVGDPSAKKALTALKVAKKVNVAQKVKVTQQFKAASRVKSGLATPATRLALPQRKAPRALMPMPGRGPAFATAAEPVGSKLRRFLDVFSSWRHGIG